MGFSAAVVFIVVGVLTLELLLADSSILSAAVTALAASEAQAAGEFVLVVAEGFGGAGLLLLLSVLVIVVVGVLGGVWTLGVCVGLVVLGGVVAGVVVGRGFGSEFCLGPIILIANRFHTSLSSAIAVSSSNVLVIGASSSMLNNMPFSNCTLTAVLTSLSPCIRSICPSH